MSTRVGGDPIVRNKANAASGVVVYSMLVGVVVAVDPLSVWNVGSLGPTGVFFFLAVWAASQVALAVLCVPRVYLHRGGGITVTNPLRQVALELGVRATVETKQKRYPILRYRGAATKLWGLEQSLRAQINSQPPTFVLQLQDALCARSTDSPGASVRVSWRRPKVFEVASAIICLAYFVLFLIQTVD